MSDFLRASLWMSGAIVSFSVMAVAGREASAELDTFEIMTYRSLIGLLIVIGLIALKRQFHTITRADLGLHGMRNLAHFAGQNLWFYALTLMPLAQLFALEFTTPIWVLLLSPFLLGRPIRAVGLLAALIGFVGILIIAQPGVGGLGPGILPAAACAICFALTVIFTKRLTARHSTYAILFYLTLMQSGFGLIATGYDLQITLPSLAILPLVVLIGLAGVTAHFCMTTALSLAPASVVSPIDFVRLPVIALVGALLYAEPLQLSVLFGAVLIFAGNYLNIITESKNNAKLTLR
ncbi:DMT family transporter [Cognatishimia sp. SS12]|uniref:DMT family transporter n=1 Tax=Cognatishimia sp. SS12 TaxID=2979465 RepID=UPI00232EEB4A|nr:DMT family transporter [Cognatishimia sp. SS12]MDC0737097.1 DMT family transporter [Cognatishimia sp. SS12]